MSETAYPRPTPKRNHRAAQSPWARFAAMVERLGQLCVKRHMSEARATEAARRLTAAATESDPVRPAENVYETVFEPVENARPDRQS